MKFLPSCLILIFTVLTSCKKDVSKIEFCKGETTIIESGIITDSTSLFIPTAFTPNADGLNDLFCLLGKGIEGYQMTIYDNSRPIYQNDSTLTYDPYNGLWNGKKEGKYVNSGNYKYELIGSFINGSPFNIIGDISVIYPKEYSSETIYSGCESCIFGDMINPREGIEYLTNEVGLPCE